MKHLQNLAIEYKKFSDKFTENKKQEFINYLHCLDEDFFHKKPNHIKAKDKRYRYLWLPILGIIRFQRRRYYDQKNNKYIFLLDQYLDIPKHQLVLREHMKLALTFYASLGSYSKISHMVFDGYLSKMSICRYIQKVKLEISLTNYKCINDGILYINDDGLWFNKWKKKKQVESKNFSFYTGKIRVSHNRYKLTGRNIISLVNISNEEIFKEITNGIEHYEDVREIRVLGDGARWIKSLAKKLGATFYLDKFHFHKTLFDLVKKENFHFVLKTINNFQIKEKEIRILLLDLVSNSKTGEINKLSVKKIGYIINNLHHYRMSMINNIESSIEAIQAHYLAKELKRRRKGFKIEILAKILKIFASQANGFFGKEAWHKKEHVDIGLFGRTGKNIPIFQHGDAGENVYKTLQHLIRHSS